MEPQINVLPPLAAPQSVLEKPADAPTPSKDAVTAKDEPAPEERPSESEVARSAMPMERRLEQINRLTKHLSFFYHRSSDTVQIRVADGSGKLVREIPSDEFIRTMERLHGNAGAILDDRA